MSTEIGVGGDGWRSVEQAVALRRSACRGGSGDRFSEFQRCLPAHPRTKTGQNALGRWRGEAELRRRRSPPAIRASTASARDVIALAVQRWSRWRPRRVLWIPSRPSPAAEAAAGASARPRPAADRPSQLGTVASAGATRGLEPESDLLKKNK